MDLETKKKQDCVFLMPLSQNLDVTVSTEFKGRVVDLITQGNHFFLLNLSHVDFIDSSGLGALISILKTLNINNGDIALCELKPPVQNLLNLTRMNNVFRIFPNEKEGVEYLVNKKKNV